MAAEGSRLLIAGTCPTALVWLGHTASQRDSALRRRLRATGSMGGRAIFTRLESTPMCLCPGFPENATSA